MASDKLPCGTPPPLGETHFQKKSVVRVPATVIPNSRTESFGDGRKILDEGVDIQGFEVFVPFEGRIKVVYVSLMVLAMVDFHGSAVKVRFESIG
jgi:hypothetical protein